MVSHRWRIIGETKYATISVDYRANMTKTETLKNIYYHKGIYPYHNPDYVRKIKK